MANIIGAGPLNETYFQYELCKLLYSYNVINV